MRRGTIISWGIVFASIAAILFFYPSETVIVTKYLVQKITFSQPKEAGAVHEIEPPFDYKRIEITSDSFGFFLRHLKLKKGQRKVYLYDGSEKGYQGAQHSIIDLDVGEKDLQQCADATIRLWAEYLFKRKRYRDIHFNFLSDLKPRYFSKFADGDFTYDTFRKYLEWVFTYANTASLFHELKTVSREELKPGDIFIQKGQPFGHAVIVVDIAIHKSTGKKIFLLAQSFMPAQEIHVLKNPANPVLSPWYSVDYGDSLVTPEYHFKPSKGYKIKRFGS